MPGEHVPIGYKTKPEFAHLESVLDKKQMELLKLLASNKLKPAVQRMYSRETYEKLFSQGKSAAVSYEDLTGNKGTRIVFACYTSETDLKIIGVNDSQTVPKDREILQVGLRFTTPIMKDKAEKLTREIQTLFGPGVMQWTPVTASDRVSDLDFYLTSVPIM